MEFCAVMEFDIAVLQHALVFAYYRMTRKVKV